jgi:ABC-type glycerol-3-phosphate transport system substrate-binding protein
MKSCFQFSQASLESATGSASEGTVVKILHVNPVPEFVEIWQAVATEYEKAHLAVKVQFDYLDSEELKAKLPMLL